MLDTHNIDGRDIGGEVCQYSFGIGICGCIYYLTSEGRDTAIFSIVNSPSRKCLFYFVGHSGVREYEVKAMGGRLVLRIFAVFDIGDGQGVKHCVHDRSLFGVGIYDFT